MKDHNKSIPQVDLRLCLVSEDGLSSSFQKYSSRRVPTLLALTTTIYDQVFQILVVFSHSRGFFTSDGDKL